MPRNKPIIIRLSEEEYKSIKGKAEHLGLSVASFMRFVSSQAQLSIITPEISKSYLKNIKKRFGS